MQSGFALKHPKIQSRFQAKFISFAVTPAFAGDTLRDGGSLRGKPRFSPLGRRKRGFPAQAILNGKTPRVYPWLFISIIAAILCAGVLFSSSVFAAEADTKQAQITAGKEKSALCASCHNADGNSATDMWPKLAGQDESYLYTQLKAFKSGDRPGYPDQTMAALVVGLSDQDMRDLAAYYASQKVAIETSKESLVERGQLLYRGGDKDKGIPACTACHGPQGHGVDAADFPAISGQNMTYTVNQLVAFSKDKRTGDMMRDIAKRMNEKDMKAVASYIEGLY